MEAQAGGLKWRPRAANLDLAHLPAPVPLYIRRRALIDECPLYVFSPYLGVGVGGGGLSRSLGHKLLLQISSLGCSKIELSEIAFFDTHPIQNYLIFCIKPVYPPFYVFFTLFGCWGGGGVGAPKGSTAQPACAVFQPR